ncbi:Cys-tRNA(Pro) deacylase [Nocardioides houyundeii]|uniref:Cys-tRNA(Pro) deacylase n=1 Tax=Nocardioides houyundeii TaxID=2045452 RepID=UPI000C7631A5|nr:Cys-tRNA(Pro) deacylase [Nocardioides houyundeii]
MAKKAGGGTPATDALQAAGVPFALRAYEHDPRVTSYGMEAAQALGVDPDRVFKTLLVDIGSTSPQLAVGVVPVTGRLDLKALAGALGAKKAVMADPAAAARATGYVVGGISPIGQRTLLPTVVDETAVLHETILVSGGKRGLDVELAPDDLVALLSASYADIAR